MKIFHQRQNEIAELSHEKLSNFRRLSIFAVSLTLLILGLCGIFSPTKQAITSAFNSVLSQPQTVTRYETKNIEDIQKDDYVLAYDVRTGEVTKRKVTDVFKRQADHLRYLTIRGENGIQQKVETTDNHAFWVVTDKPDIERMAREMVTVENIGNEDIELFDNEDIELFDENLDVTENGFYVEAKNLRVGDTFLDPSQNLLTLIDTCRIDYPEGITVYNFTVEDDHNYFVIANYEAFQNGAQPMLVHNSDACGDVVSKTPGSYLATKAPKQVTPGIRMLTGQYVNDLGHVQPWKAHYDEFGRLIGRTDYNAGNLSQGISDTHHHIFEWGPGKKPLEIGSHIPGEFQHGKH